MRNSFIVNNMIWTTSWAIWLRTLLERLTTKHSIGLDNTKVDLFITKNMSYRPKTMMVSQKTQFTMSSSHLTKKLGERTISTPNRQSTTSINQPRTIYPNIRWHKEQSLQMITLGCMKKIQPKKVTLVSLRKFLSFLSFLTSKLSPPRAD